MATLSLLLLLSSSSQSMGSSSEEEAQASSSKQTTLDKISNDVFAVVKIIIMSSVAFSWDALNSEILIGRSEVNFLIMSTKSGTRALANSGIKDSWVDDGNFEWSFEEIFSRIPSTGVESCGGVDGA